MGFNKSENFSTKRELCAEGFKLNCLVENREMDVESSSSSSLVDDASLSLSGMCCVSWADTRYIWFLLCVIANSFCLQKRI